jgi:phosphatidylglycerophosphate synthase
MSKITIKEIREKYLAGKEKERKFKWTYYVRRPVSYYLAWPFLKLGISATSVTILWLIIACIGCAFIAAGTYVNMIIGTILLELAVILDCVDGHIARFTRQTYTGDILDTWAGEILLVASIFSIGIGLSNTPDLVSKELIPIDIENYAFIYLGFFGAIAALSSWTVRLHWRTIAMRSSFNDNLEIQNSRRGIIIDNIFHYSGAVTVLMVVSSILFILDIILVLVSAVYGAFMLVVMYKIVRRARSLDSTTAKF